MPATRNFLPNGQLHFQHGPIDIIIGAEGDAIALKQAHEAAWSRFEHVLDELVAELKILRQPLVGVCDLQGVIARRMWAACEPFSQQFITPMAAVAGSVAQELIAAYARDGISKAWANNGGDIALYLSYGSSARVGLYADISKLNQAQLLNGLNLDGYLDIDYESGVRGIATSGWRGRSFSLGIADSVTVIAGTASQADAAASVIANAVNVDDSCIVRLPARALRHDSDLQDIPVTVDVPELAREKVQVALQAGLACATKLKAQGLIEACTLVCQGQFAQTASQLCHEHSLLA